MGKHVLEKEEWAIRNTRQARPEAAGKSLRVLFFYSLLIRFPVQAEGGLCEQIVESSTSMAIVRESAAKSDRLRATPVL